MPHVQHAPSPSRSRRVDSVQPEERCPRPAHRQHTLRAAEHASHPCAHLAAHSKQACPGTTTLRNRYSRLATRARWCLVGRARCTRALCGGRASAMATALPAERCRRRPATAAGSGKPAAAMALRPNHLGACAAAGEADGAAAQKAPGGQSAGAHTSHRLHGGAFCDAWKRMFFGRAWMQTVRASRAT